MLRSSRSRSPEIRSQAHGEAFPRRPPDPPPDLSLRRNELLT
jgi:hypothetical protein